MIKIIEILKSYPSLGLEVIALLTAVWVYLKEKSNQMLLFSFFLLLTVFVEWGTQYELFVVHHSNNWIFNLFNPIEFAFYAWLYHDSLRDKRARFFIRAGVAVLWLTCLFNLIFVQGFWRLNSYTYILGSILIVYTIFLYYKTILEETETREISIVRTRMFAISIGLFIFYGCETFLMAFFQYYLDTDQFTQFLPVWEKSSVILNSILYLSFIVAFWKKNPSPNI